jgi:hypothetical protein
MALYSAFRRSVSALTPTFMHSRATVLYIVHPPLSPSSTPLIWRVAAAFTPEHYSAGMIALSLRVGELLGLGVIEAPIALTTEQNLAQRLEPIHGGDRMLPQRLHVTEILLERVLFANRGRPCQLIHPVHRLYC